MAAPNIWRSWPKLVRRQAFQQHYRYYTCSARLNQGQPQGNQDGRTTHFGFETVDESQKASRVGAVFSSVAPSYDTMNDLMSLGIHRLWKDSFVRSLSPGSPTHPQRILDIAGGTADIALRLLDHATVIKQDTQSHVIVSDINPAMLSEGKRRVAESSYAESDRISWLEANAEDLSSAGVGGDSIDLYTVAFGIRNFTSITKTLSEAYRVLKPGGVFASLEFSKVNNLLLNAVYKRWSFGAIPLIGQLVAGDRDSYQYLVESIERFPSQREFCNMIREAGFLVPGTGDSKGWEDMTGGIVSIHKGIKPV